MGLLFIGNLQSVLSSRISQYTLSRVLSNHLTSQLSIAVHTLKGEARHASRPRLQGMRVWWSCVMVGVQEQVVLPHDADRYSTVTADDCGVAIVLRTSSRYIACV